MTNAFVFLYNRTWILFSIAAIACLLLALVFAFAPAYIALDPNLLLASTALHWTLAPALLALAALFLEPLRRNLR